MAILPSTLLGILPVGCLLSMRGTLSAETFLSVIVLSFGVMQPLITAFSHTDDIAQAGLQYGKDQYDRERYAELRQIAAAADRMIAVTAAVRHIFRICMVPAPVCNRFRPENNRRSANRPDRIALRLSVWRFYFSVKHIA